MEDENTNGDDEDRSRWIRFGINTRFLSDLISDLDELNVSEGPTPSGEAIDWTTADEEADLYRGGGRKRPSRVRKPAADCLLDTRHNGDEFVVLADIPGADRADLTVGIHPQQHALVIGREDAVVARVPLPWDSAESTKVAFNNGILEVRLRSTENA